MSLSMLAAILRLKLANALAYNVPVSCVGGMKPGFAMGWRSYSISMLARADFYLM